jgi:hypothetical protein
MPLSVETRLELEKRCGDWPFDDNAGQWQGEWTDDFAEWLMLAQLYERNLGEHFPVPTIAELGDPIWEGIEQSTDPRAKMARRIQDEIMHRLETKNPFGTCSYWVGSTNSRERTSVSRQSRRLQSSCG